MYYAREFFALNYIFANRINQVSGFPLDTALLRYTNLYVRFGLGHNLDPLHPTWQEYLQHLDHSDADIEWTYQFALSHLSETPSSAITTSFGCFSFSIWNTSRVRLHFRNQETTDFSPLCAARQNMRWNELRRMFTYIYHSERGIRTVVGGSWLYNLESYRRIFPPSFISTAYVSRQDYPYLVLWGQFVDRHGQVRPEPARRFTDSLFTQKTLEGVLECFPLNVFYLESPIEVFYDYYAI